jgi:Cu-Zn family superoxide dismutase
MRAYPLVASAGAVALALLCSCECPRDAHAGYAPAPTEAVAVVVPTQGSQVHGVVRFIESGDSIKVVADIEGLPPSSSHGFHIHEFGDATAADGISAGSHYNPDNHQHGGPESSEHHAGDLGNVVADATGKAHYEITSHDLSIVGEHHPILGRSVIIHANADDLTPKPNVGARIAIGVIGLAKPPAAPAK